jgi:hypothetical protein
MKAPQSSVRLAFRHLIEVGFFVLVACVLGVGMAVIAGAFVLGDLSGAWQNKKVAADNARAKGMIRVSYIAPDLHASEPAAAAAPAPAKQRIPADLAPVPPDGSVEPVRIARALPVLPDVPVRRAQPVLLTVPRTFNVKAEVTDDRYIPRARPVSPAPDQRLPDTLPAARSIAQRDSVTLNW